MCPIRHELLWLVVVCVVTLVSLTLSEADVTKPPPICEGKWKVLKQMTDEFNGDSLDASKWHSNNPAWLGRQPAYFWPGNVSVSGGKLHLEIRKQDLPDLPEGYHTYTSAAVKSKTKVLYGYFEARCKPMKAHVANAFWFYDTTPEIWTEIDVFEVSQYPGKERAVQTNAHVFHSPTRKEHWEKSEDWQLPYNVADAWHVYALGWDKDYLRYYVDYKLIRTLPNTDWHQPLYLNFDVETMPQFGLLPRDDELPATFSIDYVRAWQREL